MIETVVHVFRQRARLRWRAWIAIALVLGLGFGISLASFAAARQTASSFGRILDEARLEDATVSHDGTLDGAVASLRDLDIVDEVKFAVGYVGFVDGIGPEVTRGFIASADGHFPFSDAVITSGRFPDQSAADEVFVNTFVAERTGVEVGDRWSVSLFSNDFQSVTTNDVVVVGIGTLAREVVVDETALLGVVSLTQAFAADHSGNEVYGQSPVRLVDGADAEDLQQAVAALGLEVQESRARWRRRSIRRCAPCTWWSSRPRCSRSSRPSCSRRSSCAASVTAGVPPMPR